MADVGRICNYCVMDMSDPDIRFDESGRCNHCREAEERLASPPFCLDPKARREAADAIVAKIKRDGAKSKYDCIIGLSGGVDSSYTAYLVKRVFGLRPLAVHLDNGWNSEASVSNIENICKKLDIDLYTHVIDWEQFKNLQLAFQRASTPDTEVISDHAIVSTLYEAAAREKTRYIIGGTNYSSESIMPKAWSTGHVDWKYIKNVNRIFGNGKLSTFPHRSLLKHICYKLLYRIEWVELLNYMEYDKEAAKVVIKRELDWKDYGRKHGESNFTRIFQELILPDKFGYDKRKGHYSSLIVAGQMSRDDAMKALRAPLYESESAKNEDKVYLCSKFGISSDEFERIMSAPRKTILDYPSYERSKFYHAFMAMVRKAKS